MPMPNRTAKFASAIFASALAGVPVATISLGSVRAADDCLLAPKNETPDGGHWYYRIDHATKRHCWYLRKEGEEAMRIAPPAAASPAPIAPKAEAATPRSLADARAELPPQTRVGPPSRVEWPNPAPPAPAAAPDIPPAAVPDASAHSSVVASRWPESSSATSASSSAPAESQLAANVQPAVAAPPPAVVADPPAAAEASTQGRPGSIAVLLGVIIGALALSSLIAGLAFKIGRTRRARRSKLRARRDAIWQRTDAGRIAPSPRPYRDVVPRRPGTPRDLDRVDDPNERIEEFLSQLAKRAAS
jgi:hypothetical protein